MSENVKPRCKLINKNGNIFNLLAIASRTLRENNPCDKADEMYKRAKSSNSYEEALCIIGEYVRIE